MYALCEICFWCCSLIFKNNLELDFISNSFCNGKFSLRCCFATSTRSTCHLQYRKIRTYKNLINTDIRQLTTI